ncbi:MFS transporter [Phytomonospora sp. NPDC050363]|uniref:MFS transporter n=1 Tax=Phytomonospora sp. NPDC050363 TaxID=3155642 RepID=UPI0033FF0945
MTASPAKEDEHATSPRRGFPLLWSSSAISAVGDGTYKVAAPLLAAYLTRDPVAVSLVSAAAALPWFLVGFWSGAVVDRLPRRAVMLCADLARAAGLALLIALLVSGVGSVPLLAVTSFLMVSGQAFFDAASQALVPHLVGRDDDALARANGRLFSADTAGQALIGPPLGGALFVVAPWVPFLLTAFTFSSSAAFLAGLPKVPRPVHETEQSLIAAAKEGFRYLFRSRTLVLLALGLTAYNVAYNIGSATLVLYVQDDLRLSEIVFGLLMAASSVGAVATGLASARILKVLGTSGAVVGGIGLQAVGWLALLFAPWTWFTALAFVLLGAASTVVTVGAVTARQRAVPDRLLGRVVSAFRLIGNGAAPIGSAAGGFLAAGATLRVPMVVSVILLVITGSLIGLALRRAN